MPRPLLASRRAFAVAASLAVCVGFGLTDARLAPFADPPLYALTAENMRDGQGYYAAMDRAFEELFHTDVSSPRAFRLPTVFLLWRVLPSERAIWVALAVAVALAALVLTRITTVPEGVPIIAWYVLVNARNSFTSPEYWVLPFAALAIWLWRTGRDREAALAALAAASIREIVAGLLVGGLLAAIATRRRRWPWLAAIAALAGILALHASATQPYLDAAGGQAELLGTGSLEAMLFMLGVGLGRPNVFGPLLLLFALNRLRREPALLAIVAGVLVIPFAGFAVSRPYWGYVTVPFTLLYGIEGFATLAADAARDVRARRHTSSTTRTGLNS